jgi:uncharacterized protein YqhQ
MSDIDKIIKIAGNNTVLYIILYIVLNGVIFLTYLIITKKIKDKKTEINGNSSENNTIDNDLQIEIEKVLNKQNKKEKISSFIFLFLLIGFIGIIVIDILKIFPRKILENIYGIIILVSAYTVIPFFEYFKKINIKMYNSE